MRKVLLAAAIYNVAWAIWVGLFPNQLFDWTGAERPNYPEIWQCVAMFVGVWGIGYLVAASNPIRHWPVVMVGFLGKVLGPLGFLWAVWRDRFPSDFGWVIVFNDLIWLVPFGMILYAAYDQAIGRKRVASPEVQRMALRTKTNMGMTLEELSQLSPVMLVFLRHLGCTFCRETLADLAKVKKEIEATGTRMVLVHMSREQAAADMVARYGLANVDRVSDTKQSVYKAFGLSRGRFLDVFGPKVWWRGFQAGVLGRHGVGTLDGDGFQMPGVFVIFHGEVIRSYIHQSAADRPDYVQLASGEAFAPAKVSRLLK
jgi:peroxiredoxin